MPPCPKMCTSALQGPPLSPRSRAAPTAIAITASAAPPGDGQEETEKVLGSLPVTESNANARFAVARVPMAAPGARRFFFLGAGGGDFLLVGVLGGVRPSESARPWEAVLSVLIKRRGGKH